MEGALKEIKKGFKRTEKVGQVFHST